MKHTGTLMSIEEFEAVMPFYVTRAGGVSKEIAFAHYVMGLPTTAIVEKVGTSKQNVIKTVARFAEAHYRSQQAQRVMAAAANAPSPKIAQILATFDKPPKPKQAAPAAKKVAAKKTALKVVAAKKTPAKKASK